MAVSRIVLRPPTAALGRTAAALLSHRRRLSDKPRPNHLVEIEAADSSSDSASEEVMAYGMKKLEDAIDTIIVRRSAPDWLPFLPGSSYWVPPRGPAGGLIDVMGRLASSGLVGRRRRRSGGMVFVAEEDDEDAAAVVSSRGWPSPAFYNDGTSPIHHIPVVEVELKIEGIEDQQAEDTSDSEDEEG